MGRIRLTGATSGYTELRAANAAGNNTITLPTTTGGEVIVSDSSGNVDIDSGTFYIDASNNRVGIGTTSPQETLHLSGTGWVRTQYGSTISSIAYNAYLGIQGNNYGAMAAGDMSVLTGTSGQNIVLMADSATGTIRFASGGNTERARIDSSGRLLVGTSSSPSLTDGQYSKLHVVGNTNSANGDGFINIGRGVLASSGLAIGTSLGNLQFTDSAGAVHAAIGGLTDGTTGTNDYPGRLVFSTTADGASSPTERMRIDSSGRLLVGTSAALGEFAFQASNSSKIDLVVANAASFTAGTNQESRVVLGKTESGAVTPMGIVSARPEDPTSGAHGLLTFSTRRSEALSEKMRITSVGDVYINKTSSARSIVGAQFESTASYTILGLTATSQRCLDINRLTTDGNLIEFYQDSTLEGTVSVSGTTVSYNGAHLSRWSQLPSGVERTEILRGSVLSNIDEMCEWGAEKNEQLNRMKVSDVEGDKNVSGVFQGWDDDDDTYTNDFYCAMTGDFIIRVGAGVLVERGDLLISAGDGTAKPQDDDIIRSKTIAKVTSTSVSCTYDDGSYCVPCVLMAC